MSFTKELLEALLELSLLELAAELSEDDGSGSFVK